jgi:hypothetical protein
MKVYLLQSQVSFAGIERDGREPPRCEQPRGDRDALSQAKGRLRKLPKDDPKVAKYFVERLNA